MDAIEEAVTNTAKLFETIGINFFDELGELRDLKDVISDIVKKYEEDNTIK